MNKRFLFIACIIITQWCSASEVAKKEFFQAVDSYNTDQNNEKHINTISSILHSNPSLVDAKYTKNKCTPLWEACDAGNSRLVTLLLTKKADPNSLSNLYMQRPLHKAAHNGHTSVAITLLKHRALIDAQDSSDNTALYGGVTGAHNNTVKMLLLHSANPNLAGAGSSVLSNGYRFLENVHSAKQRTSILRMLLVAGATLSDNEKCTATTNNNSQHNNKACKACQRSTFILQEQNNIDLVTAALTALPFPQEITTIVSEYSDYDGIFQLMQNRLGTNRKQRA